MGSSPFPSTKTKQRPRLRSLFCCIRAHILIESPARGFTFLREGVQFHLKEVHFGIRGFTLFSDNANNRCMCKNRQFEADNLHTSRNTALSVFLALDRPRYRNTSRSFLQSKHP